MERENTQPDWGEVDRIKLLETVDLGTVNEDERICWDCRFCCKRRHASICNVFSSCIFDSIFLLYTICIGFNVAGLMGHVLLAIGFN